MEVWLRPDDGSGLLTAVVEMCDIELLVIIVTWWKCAVIDTGAYFINKIYVFS